MSSNRKTHHIPTFENFQPSMATISPTKKHKDVVVDNASNDDLDQNIKDFSKEIMTHLHNNDVEVYSNRMYSFKDGKAHIPIAHADKYDSDILNTFNKKGQKIRKVLQKAGFENFSTKFETDKIINGSTLWLTIGMK